ncbi:MAG: hypothetical protein ABIJ75_05895 [Actinomycetota bacterium]
MPKTPKISGLLEAYAIQSQATEIGTLNHPSLDYPLRGFIASRYVEFQSHDGVQSAAPGEYVIEGKSGQLFRGVPEDGWTVTLDGSPGPTVRAARSKAADPTVRAGAVPLVRETSAIPVDEPAARVTAEPTGPDGDGFEIGGPDDVTGPFGDDFAAIMEAAAAASALTDEDEETEEEAGGT